MAGAAGTAAAVGGRPAASGGGREALRLNWFNVAMVSAMHVGALYALLRCAPAASYRTLGLAFLLYQLSGLGITAGAHRLWAHKSYSAHWTVRVALSLCNAIAYQGSVYEWARHHRVHHRQCVPPTQPPPRPLPARVCFRVCLRPARRSPVPL